MCIDAEESAERPAMTLSGNQRDSAGWLVRWMLSYTTDRACSCGGSTAYHDAVQQLPAYKGWLGCTLARGCSVHIKGAKIYRSEWRQSYFAEGRTIAKLAAKLEKYDTRDPASSRSGVKCLRN